MRFASAPCPPGESQPCIPWIRPWSRASHRPGSRAGRSSLSIPHSRAGRRSSVSPLMGQPPTTERNGGDAESLAAKQKTLRHNPPIRQSAHAAVGDVTEPASQERVLIRVLRAAPSADLRTAATASGSTSVTGATARSVLDTLMDAATPRGVCDRLLRHPDMPLTVAVSALRLALRARVVAQTKNKPARDAAAAAGISGWQARSTGRRDAPRFRLAVAAAANEPTTRSRRRWQRHLPCGDVRASHHRQRPACLEGTRHQPQMQPRDT